MPATSPAEVRCGSKKEEREDSIATKKSPIDLCLCETESGRGFYIFTIITDDAHQIITLIMAPTTIPVEESLSYIFTIFADVARHASPTHWRLVSKLG